jgi:hypothetical protein
MDEEIYPREHTKLWTGRRVSLDVANWVHVQLSRHTKCEENSIPNDKLGAPDTPYCSTIDREPDCDENGLFRLRDQDIERAATYRGNRPRQGSSVQVQWWQEYSR